MAQKPRNSAGKCKLCAQGLTVHLSFSGIQHESVLFSKPRDRLAFYVFIFEATMGRDLKDDRFQNAISVG